MNGLPPILGSYYQASTVQRTQAGERESAIKRDQAKRKNTGATDEFIEHTVESSDEIAPLHDEERAHDERKRKKRQAAEAVDASADDDTPPRLDLTA